MKEEVGGVKAEAGVAREGGMGVDIEGIIDFGGWSIVVVFTIKALTQPSRPRHLKA